jgi:hypothetical protein
LQNRYAGDIGDYVKLALLRHLSQGRKLGISWYLYPDEGHNSDGRHIGYLSDPLMWRALDTELFDSLSQVVGSRRTVAQLEKTKAIEPNTSYHRSIVSDVQAKDRCRARTKWFEESLEVLGDCDLVFADPDNGIIDDRPERRRRPIFGKQMPLSEVKAIAEGRTAVIYHHNTRFKGGHDKEVEHWFQQIGGEIIAVRANAYSCRTFFIVNPDVEIRRRAKDFCDRWANHKVKLHT